MRLADTIAAALLERLPRDLDAAVWHRGATTVVGLGAEEVVTGQGTVAFSRLDGLGPGTWVGWCSFELGHAVEPVREAGASREPPQVPDSLFVRFGAHAVIEQDGTVAIHGNGTGSALLRAAEPDLRTHGVPSLREPASGWPPWRTSLDQPEFEDRVDAIVELLRAGECYQVNLTRRLTSDQSLDPVALFGRITRCHPAPYTGMLRVHLPGTGTATGAGTRSGAVSVVTAAPERFLRLDGNRVETRPIKGTAADPDVLRRSAKDHAENVMIVDLARNDLGRVCAPGSIHVPTLMTVESHPGLHHLVSTVKGTLREGVGLGALVAATFPPASVTGAPKPRVLQAIEELEPVRRGVYCGAFGWIDTELRQADLAVAIRTFTLFPDHAELGVGAGIVADSSPRGEWEETELKAARLLALARADVLVPG